MRELVFDFIERLLQQEKIEKTVGRACQPVRVGRCNGRPPAAGIRAPPRGRPRGAQKTGRTGERIGADIAAGRPDRIEIGAGTVDAPRREREKS
jgi:hypothetical protein